MRFGGKVYFAESSPLPPHLISFKEEVSKIYVNLDSE